MIKIRRKGGGYYMILINNYVTIKYMPVITLPYYIIKALIIERRTRGKNSK